MVSTFLKSNTAVHKRERRE